MCLQNEDDGSPGQLQKWLDVEVRLQLPLWQNLVALVGVADCASLWFLMRVYWTNQM